MSVANIKSLRMPAAPSDGISLISVSAVEEAEKFFGSSVQLSDFEAMETLTISAREPTGDPFWDEDFALRYRPYNVVDGVLTVPVKGFLISGFSAALPSYATGYEYIMRAVDRGAEDEAVKAIVLHVVSPGGDAGETPDCYDAIRRAAAVKPVITYAETALSAALWVACASTEFHASKTAEIGSVGVVMTHTDRSGQLQKNGIVKTDIFIGEEKVFGSINAPIKDEAVASFTRRMTPIYDLFVDAVSEGRRLDRKVIKDTEARVFGAAEALALGLVDKVSSRYEFLSAISATVAGSEDDKGVDYNPQEFQMSTQTDKTPKSYEQGASEALARASTIMSLPEAAGREKLAQKLAFTASALSVEDVKGILEAAPKAAAVAEAPVNPAPTNTAPTATGQFAQVMAKVEQPNVGPSATAEAPGADAEDPDGQVAAIKKSMKVA
ncbi:hypothetical protein TW83_09940 [Paracoccus sp. S4493]|uniref:S49 family peptidase n=1 Tax=Paracoccus sp. S4493 TaxID=579490 RepID=UPI0005FA0CC3|nr:S49 family peptidase [Paracoccus sp. S4493]KJZ31233.1 hypothetical protein TW83_09940 [Paracoccus sp. S4493]